jgi:poly(3-hydroxybutyrate) depolymerase
MNITRALHVQSRWSITLFLFIVMCVNPIQYANAESDAPTQSRWQQLKQIRETQQQNKESVVSEASLGAIEANLHEDTFEGRSLLVYVPSALPEKPKRRLLVALHGGGGNAEFMLQHLKMDGVAEKNGFIVAYLNGTSATKLGGKKMNAWNAGSGCCGKPYANKVDDIQYISNAVEHLQKTYGIGGENTFGVGHSNGAMMMQTLACQTTLFNTVATLAGTLMVETATCSNAKHHTIFNYHGLEDQNVPIVGGFGAKGVTTIRFTSQERAQWVFQQSGGHYLLIPFAHADHAIESISQASMALNGMSIAERIANDLLLVSPH